MIDGDKVLEHSMIDGDTDDGGKTKRIDIYETYFDSDSRHDLCLRLRIVYRIS